MHTSATELQAFEHIGLAKTTYETLTLLIFDFSVPTTTIAQSGAESNDQPGPQSDPKSEPLYTA